MEAGVKWFGGVAFLILAVVIFAAAARGPSIQEKYNEKFEGRRTSITCYSGGVVIFDGVAKGFVNKHSRGNDIFFLDVEDLRHKRVSGDCVIEVLTTEES